MGDSSSLSARELSDRTLLDRARRLRNGALIETVASYATPAGAEINERGIAPDEERIFLSDVLGSSFLDADIKGAAIAQPVCGTRR